MWRLRVDFTQRPTLGLIHWPAFRPIETGLAFGRLRLVRYLRPSESDRLAERQEARRFRERFRSWSGI